MQSDTPDACMAGTVRLHFVRDSLGFWSAKSGAGIRRFGCSAQVKEEPAQRAEDTEQNSQAV